MGRAPDPDAELMLRVKRGDLEAFEALVEKYKQPLVNFIARSLGDAEEAQDLAQSAFLQAFRAAPRYKPTARFSTWLFVIARNLCLNELRRRSRRPAESADAREEAFERGGPRTLPDAARPGPAQEALRGELLEKVEEAIRELPEPQRTALLLCVQTDLSYEEIARTLGCSLSAAKSLIHRARQTLKRRLRPYLRSGEWRPAGQGGS